jgi:lipopolysaccharide/colanic/teichoic acid biosynthesis glycosyltransferase
MIEQKADTGGRRARGAATRMSMRAQLVPQDIGQDIGPVDGAVDGQVNGQVDGTCVRQRGPYERLVKPAIDATVTAVLLLLFLPLMGIIAASLWMSLGSPILFRQARVGRGGRIFTVLKFRTMAPDRRAAPSTTYVGRDRRRTHKSRHDPRLTGAGRFLRKWSLDELPQLINVVRGDMSLVGPRPELVEIVSRYEPWQHGRHHVKPGMTGLWQVSARGNGMMHEHVDIDLRYVETVSFRTDCGILLRTIPAALGRAPGY